VSDLGIAGVQAQRSASSFGRAVNRELQPEHFSPCAIEWGWTDARPKSASEEARAVSMAP